jgi:hypothetical protein
MRKLVALLVIVGVLAFPLVAISGCGDDVKKVKKVERHRESQPEMVSPGEEIVE